MAKDFAKAFYNSKKWARCRRAYISEHPYCERCLTAGLIVPAEHVHHRIYIDEDNVNDPSITLSFDNLESLCHTCHNKEHMAHACGKDLFFNSNGELIHKSVGGTGQFPTG